MTPAETPAELELLALADPFSAVRQAQSTCIVRSPVERPEWRETLLRILRPWWENASVREMAEWLDRWAAYEPRDSARPRLRWYIRLGCLVAKCMVLRTETAAELARIEAWAFGEERHHAFARPETWEPVYQSEDDVLPSDGAIQYLGQAIWHPKRCGQLEEFFWEANEATGMDFAPLIRAAIPLETLVP